MKSLSNCFYTQYHFGHSKYCDKNLFSVDFLYSLFEHNPENVIYFKVDFFQATAGINIKFKPEKKSSCDKSLK